METETRGLSQIIVEAMRRYSFDVEKLSRLTGISERFIGDMIEERFGDLPAVPYARGYLKKISEALNLNGDEIWRVYLKDRREIRRSGEADKLPGNRFVLMPFWGRSAVIAIAVVILAAGYFFLRNGNIFGRPGIDLTGFSGDYLVWERPDFVFQGQIEPLAVLTMNGSPLYPDEEGIFETIVRLQPGLNNFEFKARKLLGKESLRTVQILYQTSTTNASQ